MAKTIKVCRIKVYTIYCTSSAKKKYWIGKLKPPQGAGDQSMKLLTDISGSKSQRPAEEKELTES